MIICWGHRLYGKTLEAKGVFHVATKCFYLQFLPFIPADSYLILAKDGDKFSGIPVGIIWRSFGMAWLRTACVLTMVVGPIIGLIAFSDNAKVFGWTWLLTGAAALILMIATYWMPFFAHADYAQAVGLLERAQETARAKTGDRAMAFEALRLQLDVAYGIVSPAEADAAFAALQPQAALPNSPNEGDSRGE